MAKGRKTGGGSRKGKPNKVSKTAREAALLAMIEHGANGRGQNGLDGFYQQWAKDDLPGFRERIAAPMATRMTVELNADELEGGQLSIGWTLQPVKPGADRPDS